MSRSAGAGNVRRPRRPRRSRHDLHEPEEQEFAVGVTLGQGLSLGAGDRPDTHGRRGGEACRPLVNLARQLDVEVPVAEQVVAVCYGNRPPRRRSRCSCVGHPGRRWRTSPTGANRSATTAAVSERAVRPVRARPDEPRTRGSGRKGARRHRVPDGRRDGRGGRGAWAGSSRSASHSCRASARGLPAGSARLGAAVTVAAPAALRSHRRPRPATRHRSRQRRRMWRLGMTGARRLPRCRRSRRSVSSRRDHRRRAAGLHGIARRSVHRRGRPSLRRRHGGLETPKVTRDRLMIAAAGRIRATGSSATRATFRSSTASPSPASAQARSTG